MNVEVWSTKTTGLAGERTSISSAASLLMLLDGPAWMCQPPFGHSHHLRNEGAWEISKALSQTLTLIPPGKGCRRRAVSKMVLNPSWPEQCKLPPQMAGLRASATWKNSLSPWMRLLNLSQDSEVPTANSHKSFDNKGKDTLASKLGKMRLVTNWKIPQPASPPPSHPKPQGEATAYPKMSFSQLSQRLPWKTESTKSCPLPNSGPSNTTTKCRKLSSLLRLLHLWNQLCNRPVLPANSFNSTDTVYCILQLRWNSFILLQSSLVSSALFFSP